MSDRRSPEDVVREIFAATDALDTEAKLQLVTEDVRLGFGNEDVMNGKAALKDVSDAVNDSVRAISHDITGLWRIDGGAGADDVILTELQVHYTRLDGGELTLPCFNAFRVRDGLISDYRVYMDMTPVYA